MPFQIEIEIEIEIAKIAPVNQRSMNLQGNETPEYESAESPPDECRRVKRSNDTQIACAEALQQERFDRAPVELLFIG